MDTGVRLVSRDHATVQMAGRGGARTQGAPSTWCQGWDKG